MWQKCPVCNGNGMDPQVVSYTNGLQAPKCPVCQGSRIINESTGLPPINNKSVNPTPQDPRHYINQGYIYMGGEEKGY